MAYTITINPDGQITIPDEIRKALDLNPGDQLEVTLENGQVVMHQRRPSPFEMYIGAFPAGDGFDAVQWVRDMRDDEDAA